MRIDPKHTLAAWLVASIAACSGFADPDDRAAPGDGDSMQALGPDDDLTTSTPPRPPPPPPRQACDVDGQYYAHGYVVPSGDCNVCRCNDGSVACTQIDCGVGMTGASCEVAGQTFADGTDVPSGDGCNTCSCSDGKVACTEIGCETTACDLFVEASDGACTRFPLDPCTFQDPDCGIAATFCQAGGQAFADGGEVPSGDTCNTCSCSSGQVACTERACDTVFCAIFVEESDGVCGRFPLDPCSTQDPDCGIGVGACDVAAQTFPNGAEVPSGDSCNSCACSDGSVICTAAVCAPIACTTVVEEADGVCTRFPLDPCRAQDPDCAGAPPLPMAPPEPLPPEPLPLPEPIDP